MRSGGFSRRDAGDARIWQPAAQPVYQDARQERSAVVWYGSSHSPSRPAQTPSGFQNVPGGFPPGADQRGQGSPVPGTPQGSFQGQAGVNGSQIPADPRGPGQTAGSLPAAGSPQATAFAGGQSAALPLGQSGSDSGNATGRDTRTDSPARRQAAGDDPRVRQFFQQLGGYQRSTWNQSQSGYSQWNQGRFGQSQYGMSRFNQASAGSNYPQAGFQNQSRFNLAPASTSLHNVRVPNTGAWMSR